MGALDNIVFKNKKFSDILSEIYDNQKKKEIQRTLNNSSSDDSLGITDEEKQQLMAELDKLNTNFEENNNG